MSLHVNINSFLVSSDKRPPEAQELTDESFKIRTLPLHELMFKGESDNYAYVGIERDYVFYGESSRARYIIAKVLQSSMKSTSLETLNT